MLNDACDRNLITLICFKGKFNVCHLMHENDILLCFRANKRSYNTIRDIFQMYEVLTNERINMSKFKIFFPRDTSRSLRMDICHMVQFKEGYFSFNYLEGLVKSTELV